MLFGPSKTQFGVPGELLHELVQANFAEEALE